MDLDDWRSRINDLDEQILSLLNQRGHGFPLQILLMWAVECFDERWDCRAADLNQGEKDVPHPLPFPLSPLRPGQFGPAPLWLRLCRAAPYRRFATCRPLPIRMGFEASAPLPITNRGYGRLQICATPEVSSKPWLAA